MSYLLRLLTSFSGRINRKSWWVGNVIVLIAIMAGAILLYPEAANAETEPVPPPPLAYTIWGLLCLIPATAITVKRFNDCDWPAWIGYAYGILSAILVIAAFFGFAVDAKNITPTESATYAVYFVFTLFCFMVNGFLRGTRGPNSDGPDPLEKDAIMP